MRSGLACIAVVLVLSGCGDDGAATGGSGSSGSESSGDSTDPSGTSEAITSSSSTSSEASSSSSGSSSDLPPACEGLESPFVVADCLTGLQDRCRAAADETACEQTESIFFDGGYAILCGWAKVVTVADIDACTIDSVAGRCEAGISQTISCADRCTDTPDLYASLKAIVADDELVEMPCAPDGNVLDGPLGPWSAVGAEPGATGTCAEDIQPPAPAICMCRAEACAAE